MHVHIFLSHMNLLLMQHFYSHVIWHVRIANINKAFDSELAAKTVMIKILPSDLLHLTLHKCLLSIIRQE